MYISQSPSIAIISLTPSEIRAFPNPFPWYSGFTATHSINGCLLSPVYLHQAVNVAIFSPLLFSINIVLLSNSSIWGKYLFLKYSSPSLTFSNSSTDFSISAQAFSSPFLNLTNLKPSGKVSSFNSFPFSLFKIILKNSILLSNILSPPDKPYNLLKLNFYPYRYSLIRL